MSAIAASITGALFWECLITVGPTPFIKNITDHTKANIRENHATESTGIKLIRV